MVSEPTLPWGSSKSLVRVGDLNPVSDPQGLSAAFLMPLDGLEPGQDPTGALMRTSCPAAATGTT